jgi:hypothetical protein
VHVFVVGIVTALSMSMTAHAPPWADSAVRPDTGVTVSSDSAPERVMKEPDVPAPAIGPVESATSTSFAMSERLMPDFPTGLDTTGSMVPRSDSLESDAAVADTTIRSRRPRAIEYSEAYHTRLKIHQIGAYAMLPLFISEYIIGQKLLTSTNRSNGLKTAHSLIAGGVGIVFVSNTITGVWNYLDSRKDPNGRTRRIIHSALMLASDAGFVWTATSASGAKKSLTQARKHRAIALSSISLSAIGSGMMWLWRN